MRWQPRRVVTATTAIVTLAAATALAQDAIITGTDGVDFISGTPASESIYARAGNDTVNGGPGDDELDGGPGGDVLNGGPGSDSVAYSGPTGVSVTLNGQPDDGAPGEGDNVGIDVEDIFGGDGPDKLNGSSAANTIDGGDGDDRITGGRGKDAIFGGGGDDDIDSRDGAVDTLQCGPGEDDARIDRIDRLVDKSCEDVDRPRRTITPGLTIPSSRRFLIVSSIVAGSKLAIACVRGCHPSSPPSRAIIRRQSVQLRDGRTVRFSLPRRISGATIELGVSGPGTGDTRCVRYRIGRGFSSLSERKGVRCTTVARRLHS